MPIDMLGARRSLDFACIPWHDCAAGIARDNRQNGIYPLTRFLKQTLAAIALAALSLSGSAAAQSNDIVKATHGDWEIRCSEGDKSVCVMSQIGKTADGKSALEVRIRKLEEAKTKDGKVIPAAIQITTPLGSILRAGVRVQIDASEPRTGKFEVCVPSGCVVRDAMSEEFLSQLMSGNSATLTFGLLQQGEVVTTISLKGFTKAFKAL